MQAEHVHASVEHGTRALRAIQTHLTAEISDIADASRETERQDGKNAKWKTPRKGNAGISSSMIHTSPRVSPRIIGYLFASPMEGLHNGDRFGGCCRRRMLQKKLHMVARPNDRIFMNDTSQPIIAYHWVSFCINGVGDRSGRSLRHQHGRRPRRWNSPNRGLGDYHSSLRRLRPGL